MCPGKRSSTWVGPVLTAGSGTVGVRGPWDKAAAQGHGSISRGRWDLWLAPSIVVIISSKEERKHLTWRKHYPPTPALRPAVESFNTVPSSKGLRKPVVRQRCAPAASCRGAGAAVLPGWARTRTCQAVLSCADLCSGVPQQHCNHQGNASGVTPQSIPILGLGLGWGCRATLPALQPQHTARLGGSGGFALFTLQLWLWLEFVKGSG